VQGLAQHFTVESLREHLLAGSERMPSGCLEFRANTRYPYAYQKISVRARAHVAAYAVFIGPIDRALVIDHICEIRRASSRLICAR